MGDILSTVLVPTERPPQTLDVKRALLLFDRVHLMSPDDREPFPRETLTMVTMPIPLFAMDMGPALPLGKVAGYDTSFERLLDECQPAMESGTLVVRGSPPPPLGMTIGHFPVPEGQANPQWVFQIFRALASSRDYLRVASRGIPGTSDLRNEDLSTLAPGGAALEMNFGNLPVVASPDDGSLPDDLKASIRVMAAARVATIVKMIGMAQVTGLHPFAVDDGVAAFLDQIQQLAAKSMAAELAATNDAEIVRRAKRVERFIFCQHLPDVALDRLSVSDVIRLRTRAWGRAGEKRAAFFREVRKISDELASDEAFDAAVARELTSYRTANAEFDAEVRRFGMQACAPVVAGAGELLAKGHLLEHVFGTSWDVAAIVSASMAALGKVGPDIYKLWKQSRDNSASAGRALMSPYIGIGDIR